MLAHAVHSQSIIVKNKKILLAALLLVLATVAYCSVGRIKSVFKGVRFRSFWNKHLWPSQSSLRDCVRSHSPQKATVAQTVLNWGPPAFNASLYESILSRVEPEFRERCSSVFFSLHNPPLIFSQAHQDWYAFHNYFRALNDPTKGVYLDIGSNDPVVISNTLFFDKCLGWKGVCVEPNPEYAERYLTEHRSCRHVKNCVWHHRQTMKFHFAGVISGLHVASDVSALSGNDGEVECLTLRDILVQHQDILGGPDEEGRYGTALNYLSVDIEGAEPELLTCTDLSGVFSPNPEVQLWNIETNHAGDKLLFLDNSLMNAGFVKVAALLEPDHKPLDDLWLMNRNRHTHVMYQLDCETATGSKTCSLYDLMDSSVFPFSCDA